ncbi:MAG: PhnD/SsuA/transferrin family substrate-binding protein [Planctomycetes bacterium]|nr:PhnD/SsuA/transferrin family substrate-binding protein [Planctomycetota bacterium]
MNHSFLTRYVVCLTFLLLITAGCEKTPDDPSPAAPALNIIVMDPLAAPLACACVGGYAQRNYDALAAFLSDKIDRQVNIAYGENLIETIKQKTIMPDLIIGKYSTVVFDSSRASLEMSPLASLTGKDGSIELYGMFVVAAGDTAKSVSDLNGRTICFGPKWEDEKHAAAIETLKENKISLPQKIRTSPSCSGAALAVAEKDYDAAIVSSYAMPLLEGCTTIDKGSLRVIGKTHPVPFVTAFVSKSLDKLTRQAVRDALLAVKENKELLEKMESKSGFVPFKKKIPIQQKPLDNKKTDQFWTDWRGPARDGKIKKLPEKLSEKPRFLWRIPLTGFGLAGIAATDKYVIVADKNKAKTEDIFLCLNADTGDEIWRIEYPAAGDMEYSNSPRANPVIYDGMVYLLGAFGDLHCVELATREIKWKKNYVTDLGGKLPPWGVSAAPLIVDGKVIVNPGGKDCSLAALDPKTGDTIWKTPGLEAAYSSFIVATLGGVKQIAGLDSISIGGWDIETGKRLWQLIPTHESDFNVSTLIDLGGKLLASTENNGTRIYDFDDNGKIIEKPLAKNEDLAHDCATPVVVNGLVIGTSSGLICLDIKDNLRTAWTDDDDAFYDFATFIADDKRVLVTGIEGDLALIEATAESLKTISRVKLFDKAEIWSHPAIVGDRLYIRSHTEIACIKLTD